MCACARDKVGDGELAGRLQSDVRSTTSSCAVGKVDAVEQRDQDGIVGVVVLHRVGLVLRLLACTSGAGRARLLWGHSTVITRYGHTSGGRCQICLPALLELGGVVEDLLDLLRRQKHGSHEPAQSDVADKPHGEEAEGRSPMNAVEEEPRGRDESKVLAESGRGEREGVRRGSDTFQVVLDRAADTFLTRCGKNCAERCADSSDVAEVKLAVGNMLVPNGDGGMTRAMK